MKVRNLENLRVWQETRSFVNEIYELMYNCKDYSFRDQLQRASISIMNNIAEGSESGSDKAYIRYLNVSRGSCSEVKSMLYLCEDMKFCTPEKRKELQSKLLIISGQIYKLIEFLKNNQKN
ncbi:MAG: four helix bundle protein [Bacteroidales bacterium]|nr:four helix bundle protein [Bacteroidales bacterium]